MSTNYFRPFLLYIETHDATCQPQKQIYIFFFTFFILRICYYKAWRSNLSSFIKILFCLILLFLVVSLSFILLLSKKLSL